MSTPSDPVGKEIDLPKFQFPGQQCEPSEPVSFADLVDSLQKHCEGLHLSMAREGKRVSDLEAEIADLEKGPDGSPEKRAELTEKRKELEAAKATRAGLESLRARHLADQLSGWLQSRAGNGCEASQANLFDLARSVVDRNWWCLDQGCEGSLRRARQHPEIPGFVSRANQVTAFWKEELTSWRQGEETSLPRPKGEGANWVMTSPQYRLAGALIDYMSGVRAQWRVAPLPVRDPRDRTLLDDILALDPLSENSSAAWYRVGKRIVDQRLGAKGRAHHLIASGLLAPLSQKEKGLTADLSEAFRRLAAAR